MTIVNASSKILFTILIFVVVQESEDYQLLILLNSCGYLLAGLLSVILVYRQFHLRLHWATWSDIRMQLKEGSAVFGSTFGMYLYRAANVVILRQFVSDDIVGLYSAAEKVVKGFQSIISPAAQALFPHLSLRFKGQPVNEQMRMLRKVSIPFTSVVLVVTLRRQSGSLCRRNRISLCCRQLPRRRQGCPGRDRCCATAHRRST